MTSSTTSSQKWRSRDLALWYPPILRIRSWYRGRPTHEKCVGGPLVVELFSVVRSIHHSDKCVVINFTVVVVVVSGAVNGRVTYAMGSAWHVRACEYTQFACPWYACTQEEVFEEFWLKLLRGLRFEHKYIFMLLLLGQASMAALLMPQAAHGMWVHLAPKTAARPSPWHACLQDADSNAQSFCEGLFDFSQSGFYLWNNNKQKG